LAEKMAMSERNFARHYRQATGYTPAKAVELIRLEAARMMLENHASINRRRDVAALGVKSLCTVHSTGPLVFHLKPIGNAFITTRCA